MTGEVPKLRPFQGRLAYLLVAGYQPSPQATKEIVAFPEDQSTEPTPWNVFAHLHSAR